LTPNRVKDRFASQMEPPKQIASVLTCPHCYHQSAEIMPTDACQFFDGCKGCGIRLKPRQGDCCVLLLWFRTVPAGSGGRLLFLMRG
jgi:hypothetical protein